MSFTADQLKDLTKTNKQLKKLYIFLFKNIFLTTTAQKEGFNLNTRKFYL